MVIGKIHSYKLGSYSSTIVSNMTHADNYTGSNAIAIIMVILIFKYIIKFW